MFPRSEHVSSATQEVNVPKVFSGPLGELEQSGRNSRIPETLSELPGDTVFLTSINVDSNPLVSNILQNGVKTSAYIAQFWPMRMFGVARRLLGLSGGGQEHNGKRETAAQITSKWPEPREHNGVK